MAAAAVAGNEHLQKSLATAHAKGRAAYEAGEPRGACPYNGRMVQKFRIHWLAGWDEGQRGVDGVKDLLNEEHEPMFYGLTASATYGAVRRLYRGR